MTDEVYYPDYFYRDALAKQTPTGAYGTPDPLAVALRKIADATNLLDSTRTIIRNVRTPPIPDPRTVRNEVLKYNGVADVPCCPSHAHFLTERGKAALTSSGITEHPMHAEYLRLVEESQAVQS